MGKSCGMGMADLLSAAFASTPDVIVVTSLESGRFLEINEAFVTLSGYSREEALGKTAEELGFWFEGDRRLFRERLEREGVVREVELGFRRGGEETRRYQVSAALARHEGRPCILSIIRDVTESSRLLEELGKANFLLERAEEMAKIGSWEFDYSTRKVSGSEGAARIYGVAREELSVASMEAVPLPEYRPYLDRARDEHIAAGKPYDIEFKIRRRSDGAVLDIHSKALWDGGRKRLFGIIRDVTEEKLVEEGLRRTIAERDTLIHELTHRTNNSLQLILSLLKLEEGAFASPEEGGRLERLSRRIGALALVHENLYCSGELDRIELRDFLPSLVAELLARLPEEDRPRVEYRLEDLSLRLDAAMPCGIIVGELVENAFLHAYPRGRPGPVRIGARREGGGLVEIYVEDEGRGMRPGAAVPELSPRGLALARSLGEGQLHGSFSVSGPPGCRCLLRFWDGPPAASRPDPSC